jgi:amidase
VGIDGALDKFKLDALIAPTGSAAWSTNLLNGGHSVAGSSSLAAVVGYPNINGAHGIDFWAADRNFLLWPSLERGKAK